MAQKKFNAGRKPSLDAQVLLDALLEMEPGDFMSYKRLSGLIGKDVQRGEGYRALRRARKILERDEGEVITPVLGQGIKCLTDAEKVDSAHGFVGKARRASSRCIRRATRVKSFESLPNDKKVQHNLMLSIAGAIHHLSRPKTQKQLEANIVQSRKALGCEETLNAVMELDIK